MRPAGLVVTVILMTGGCDPPPLSPNDVVGVFGSAGRGPGDFAYPRAIAEAPDGKLYVVDKSARVQRFDAWGQFELVWTMPDHAAGKPVGLSVHPDGRVFIADTHYSRVMVFDRDGRELARFGEHGTGAGQFIWPTDVAFDADGRIYVGEYNGNDRITRATDAAPGGSGDRSGSHSLGGGRLQPPHSAIRSRRAAIDGVRRDGAAAGATPLSL